MRESFFRQKATNGILLSAGFKLFKESIINGILKIYTRVRSVHFTRLELMPMVAYLTVFSRSALAKKKLEGGGRLALELVSDLFEVRRKRKAHDMTAGGS